MMVKRVEVIVKEADEIASHFKIFVDNVRNIRELLFEAFSI